MPGHAEVARPIHYNPFGPPFFAPEDEDGKFQM